MGNIDLSRLVFPPNTAGGCRVRHGESRAGGALPALQPPLLPPRPPGRNVEAFARRALWDVGLNYGHGTGHGIGNFLSVHECRCWGAARGQRDQGSPPEGVSPFPQGPWVSSPTTCRWPRACSRPSVGAPGAGPASSRRWCGAVPRAPNFCPAGEPIQGSPWAEGGAAGVWHFAGHRSCPQSPATTGMESSGSASRTSPWWWRRRPR